MITITVTDGPHEGLKIEVSQLTTIVVGRSETCQLCLRDDPFLSRHHFRLEVNGHAGHLLDLGSRGGTRLNRVRVESAALANGDVITVGKSTITVAMPEDQSSVATVDCDVSELRTLGGYAIAKRVGHGAMGEVFQATHVATGETVALKLIRGNGNTTQATELFVREANILSRLEHRRIIKFREFGMANGQMFLATDFVDCLDAMQLLDEQPWHERVRIACGIVAQALDGLAHAHEMSIVHRDIKPSNILVERKNMKLAARIADFGLAKNFIAAGLTDISQDNPLRGSLPYMSPEQLLNCRYAKPPCDIYAVGACLYYYLTGQYMFDCKMDASMLAHVLHEDPIPVQARDPRVAQSLANIIEKATSRLPSDRFSDPLEMKSLLAKASA